VPVTVGTDSVTRVAAYNLCVDAERRILLCRIADATADNGKWTLPGGGLEFGERPEAATLRELEEEAGLIGELDGVAGLYTETVESSAAFGGRPLHVVGVIFRTSVIGGALRDEVDGTTDTCAWFDEELARSLPHVELLRVGLNLAFGSPL
jgi:8-oxo-dGTP diphosphatase